MKMDVNIAALRSRPLQRELTLPGTGEMYGGSLFSPMFGQKHGGSNLIKIQHIVWFLFFQKNVFF